MKKETFVGLIVLIGFFCFSGLSWAEKGVTGTEIKVGTHLALTGPAAVVGKPIEQGIQMHFDYINAQGGIHGRTLTLIAEDDAFLPSRAKEAVKKLITRDQVFCILGPLQGAGIMAALPDIMEEKIPVLWCMSALDDLYQPPKRYITGWCISYEDSTNIMVNFAVNELKVKRFAFINQWGPVGDVNVKSAQMMTEKFGAELLMNEKLQDPKMDYSGLVSKMKAQNVDCVVITTTAQWVIPILKEIERQGWDVNRIIGMATGNPEILAALGGSAAEGAYVTTGHVPTDYEGEPMITYRSILAQYGKGAQPSMYHFIGYALTKLFIDGLQQTGRDLTREKLLDTYEGWKNYETGWQGKVSISPNDRISGESQLILKMVGGKGILQGSWRSPVQ